MIFFLFKIYQWKHISNIYTHSDVFSLFCAQHNLMLEFDHKNHLEASHINNTPCMTLSARRIIWILVPPKSIVRVLQYIGGNWTHIGGTLVGLAGHSKFVFSLSIYANGTRIASTSITTVGGIYNCLHYVPLHTLNDEINDQ